MLWHRWAAYSRPEIQQRTAKVVVTFVSEIVFTDFIFFSYLAAPKM
jgi:hypothetical protein